MPLVRDSLQMIFYLRISMSTGRIFKSMNSSKNAVSDLGRIMIDVAVEKCDRKGGFARYWFEASSNCVCMPIIKAGIGLFVLIALKT